MSTLVFPRRIADPSRRIADPSRRIADPSRRIADPSRRSTVIEVVLPVYNEERVLEASVRRLRTYLDYSIPFTSVITIADNASTDGTWAIASRLCHALAGVHATHLDQKGRGRALRSVWLASEAEVVAYMDIDLSTDLGALLPLVAPLISGHSDLAIGTRLASGSRVVCGPNRELISRIYNLMVKATLRSRFSDAQCGFKALRRDAALALLPLSEDNEWFFDTELLLLAERNGLRIHEVPVDWVDDADSRVHLTSTALNDVKGLARMVAAFAAGRGRAAGSPVRVTVGDGGELTRFAGVGLLSTTTYLLLFALAQPLLGSYVANMVALILCTTANTAAHVRFTFGARGPFRLRDQLVGGAVAFVTCALLTTTALAVVDLSPGPSLAADLMAVMAGTAVAAVIRFIVLRAWAFRSHTRSHPSPGFEPESAPEPEPEPESAPMNTDPRSTN